MRPFIPFALSTIAFGIATFAAINSFSVVKKPSAIAYACGFVAAQHWYAYRHTGEKPVEFDFCTKYRLDMLAMPEAVGGSGDPMRAVYQWSEKSL